MRNWQYQKLGPSQTKPSMFMSELKNMERRLEPEPVSRRDRIQRLLCKHKFLQLGIRVGGKDIKASPEWQGFSWQDENPLLPNSAGPGLPRNTLTWPRACYSEHLSSEIWVAHFGAGRSLPQISLELPHLSDPRQEALYHGFHSTSFQLGTFELPTQAEKKCFLSI